MARRLLIGPNLELPWSYGDEDNRRYKKIFLFLFIPFLMISVAIPLINVPEPKREELEKLPPQLAKVVLEKKELPKPTPKPTPPPKKKEKKEEKKEEKKKEKPKETPKPKPTPKPQPEPEQVKLVEKAREQAQEEINQFADSLSEMRDMMTDLEDLNNDVSVGTGKAAEVSRDIIDSGAAKSSGGINTAKLSRDTGGTAVSGKKSTAAVKSKLKTEGGGKAKVAAQSEDRSTRSREEIRKIMDKNKSAIYAIYNRALRKNPALEGKVVFKIEIDQNGRVVNAVIVSSELNDPALERKLIARIKLINFGAKSVLKTTINYDMDFLPY